MLTFVEVSIFGTIFENANFFPAKRSLKTLKKSQHLSPIQKCLYWAKNSQTHPLDPIHSRNRKKILDKEINFIQGLKIIEIRKNISMEKEKGTEPKEEKKVRKKIDVLLAKTKAPKLDTSKTIEKTQPMYQKVNNSLCQ